MEKITNKKNIIHFTEWSLHYDEDFWSWYFRYCSKRVLKLIKELGYYNNELELLDIGCGTGIFLKGLVDDGEYKYLHGIDVTPSMLTIANRRLEDARDLVLERCAIEDFNSEKRYNVITCLNVFHHIEDQDLMLNKVSRLLEQNGIFILLDPIRDNLLRLFWEYISKKFIFNEPDIRHYTKATLIKKFNGLNFQKKQSESILYFILLSVWKK